MLSFSFFDIQRLSAIQSNYVNVFLKQFYKSSLILFINWHRYLNLFSTLIIIFATITSYTIIKVYIENNILCITTVTGDFAVLVRSGLTIKKAMFYNFLATIPKFLGAVIGLTLGSQSSASLWIFAMAGGMFLYITLVDLVSGTCFCFFITNLCFETVVGLIGLMLFYLLTCSVVAVHFPCCELPVITLLSSSYF